LDSKSTGSDATWTTDDFVLAETTLIDSHESPRSDYSNERTNDTTPTNNITRTAAGGNVNSSNSLTVVVKETSTVLLSTAKANVELETSDGVRSLDHQQQPSRPAEDETGEAAENGKPTTAGRDQNAVPTKDGAAEQEPGTDADLTETDSGAGNEPRDADLACLAAVQGSDTSEKSVSPHAVSNDPAETLHEPAVIEANQPTTPGALATDATASPAAARRVSGRADAANPFAKAADRLFSGEKSESDGRPTGSQTLPMAKGALLLVTLGKPLTRLTAEDGRCTVANTDCDSPNPRSAFGRARRSRRRTAQAQRRWQRQKDARDTTWLLSEMRPTDRPEEAKESAPKRAGNSQPPLEPISPCLADLAVLSHLAVTGAEDRSKSPESRPATLPCSAGWDGCGLLAAGSAVTLSGTISVLAIERCRRARRQQRPVRLPIPAYTGATVARAV